jgi:non-canonical purine NTP pyrophosphatase (RdgB/HAM1 family)
MMRLDDLLFVTSNLNKLREAQQVLDAQIGHRAIDLPEIQSLNLEEVVRYKARAAYSRLGKPVLVEDTSLELHAMDGFPGPLIRWVLSSVGPIGICTLATAFGDRRATVRCMVCAADGSTEAIGIGSVDGQIATKPSGRKGFGWDSTFIAHEAGGRTYAQMTAAEKNAISHRRKALEDLRRKLRVDSR